ncbi:MAG TPA: MBL fold metallo-hydrolase RNA specificity domain-containing protein [Lacunisphaera sp.]|jgi:Cft2 family RNA processing exonuclease
MAWDVRFNDGINLPQIGWWLDARRAQFRSFVSHAHGDHIGAHREILATRATASLMRLRISGRRRETILEFEQPWPAEFGCEMCLFPAGHIFGSAMLHTTTEHGSLLYTGDFKLRPGLAAETCIVPRADVLIMETTFGLPRYVFPPADEIEHGIVDFCRIALADRVTPVIYAYSLGKTQELLQIVGRASLPVMLHAHGYKMTERYRELGMKLPPYSLLNIKSYAGHVVIAPPMSGQTEPITWINPKRTAIVSGWALDSGAARRFGCDAAFPLSDHADFPDLLAFVEKVEPKVIFTLHGFAKEFAGTLRTRGIEAHALSATNQIELAL